MDPAEALDSVDLDRELIDHRLDLLRGRGSGPVNWAALTVDQAASHWTTLRTWVTWLRSTFGYDHRVVPPCWYEHSALVELLSALCDHWLSAYDPLNSPTAASEWHRVLAQLEPRLREWAAHTGCTTREHRPDLAQPVPDDRAQWARHLGEDAARRKDQTTERKEGRP